MSGEGINSGSAPATDDTAAQRPFGTGPFGIGLIPGNAKADGPHAEKTENVMPQPSDGVK